MFFLKENLKIKLHDNEKVSNIRHCKKQYSKFIELIRHTVSHIQRVINLNTHRSYNRVQPKFSHAQDIIINPCREPEAQKTNWDSL